MSKQHTSDQNTDRRVNTAANSNEEVAIVRLDCQQKDEIAVTAQCENGKTTQPTTPDNSQLDTTDAIPEQSTGGDTIDTKTSNTVLNDTCESKSDRKRGDTIVTPNLTVGSARTGYTTFDPILIPEYMTDVKSLVTNTIELDNKLYVQVNGTLYLAVLLSVGPGISWSAASGGYQSELMTYVPIIRYIMLGYSLSTPVFHIERCSTNIKHINLTNYLYRQWDERRYPRPCFDDISRLRVVLVRSNTTFRMQDHVGGEYIVLMDPCRWYTA